MRWTGTVNGQPAALYALRPDRGGVLAYAMHGSSTSCRQDCRAFFPAPSISIRPIAWWMRADGKAAKLIVVPTRATRVGLTIDGAEPVPVPIDASGSGSATLKAGQKVTVIAYDERPRNG